jgi:hypothetical protein
MELSPSIFGLSFSMRDSASALQTVSVFVFFDVGTGVTFGRIPEWTRTDLGVSPRTPFSLCGGFHELATNFDGIGDTPTARKAAQSERSGLILTYICVEISLAPEESIFSEVLTFPENN